MTDFIILLLAVFIISLQALGAILCGNFIGKVISRKSKNKVMDIALAVCSAFSPQIILGLILLILI